MQITCAQPHRVSDVIFDFEKSDLTPYYATADSSILAKSNFHTPPSYGPGFYLFLFVFLFLDIKSLQHFFKEVTMLLQGPGFTSLSKRSKSKNTWSSPV